MNYMPNPNLFVNMMILLVCMFIMYVIVLYVRNVYRLRKYFKKLRSPKMAVADVQVLAQQKGRNLPTIAIFVPARNEGYVIANTATHLAVLDYPKDLYRVFFIVDEREMDDNVEELTKDVLQRLSEPINRDIGFPLFTTLEVPKWYSGAFGDPRRTYKNSTKGRALNYALDHIRDSEGFQSTIIGVLDADGRLDKNVLKEVAQKQLLYDSKLMQGPVFQITNFGRVAIIGVLGALELAIHHMTEIPKRLLSKKRRLQVLAGTNYFIEKDRLIEMGGWNCDSLVEDAELAVRVYAERRITAHWLSWPEVEQTVPCFSVYKRQRERWVRGFLGLSRNIRRLPIPISDKIRFISKTYLLLIRVMMDVGAMLFGVMLILSGVLRDLAPPFQILLLGWVLLSMVIWDFYGLMFRMLAVYINPEMTMNDKIVNSGRLFFFMPVFVFAHSIPKVTGYVKYLFWRDKEIWHKTERTREEYST